jgi:hypothetical protein
VVVEVLRYTSIDVLEPLWWHMFTRVKQAANMDEVRACVRRRRADATLRVCGSVESILGHVCTRAADRAGD